MEWWFVVKLGQLQISNEFDASQVLINPAIPEVDEFKNTYSGDISLTMIQGNEVMPMENNNQLEFSG
uniref:Uncharacterized protein n=2 Tax=Brassica campestris TaxID=3711 RepID=M4ERM1_BRACM